MKKTSLSVLFINTILVFSNFVYSQVLSEISIRPKGYKIEVPYIISCHPKYSKKWKYDLEISFRTKKDGLVIPKTIEGEIHQVAPDAGLKYIRWDIQEDLGKKIDDSVSLQISIKHLKGPFALRHSILVPGRGVYQTTGGNKRPWHKPIIIWGSIISGTIIKNRASLNYERYYNTPDYREGMMELKNGNLLNQIGWGLITVGISYWLLDLTEVTIRGIKNTKLQFNAQSITDSGFNFLPTITLNHTL